MDRAAHLLPAQGPIAVFIHHNTLHAFEHEPFEDAVCRGGRVFGCQSFLSAARYRESLGAGRIKTDELRSVLEEELRKRPGTIPGSLGSRERMLFTMLEHRLAAGSAEELHWHMAESEALLKMQPGTPAAARTLLGDLLELLWEVCREGIRRLPKLNPPERQKLVRHRDLLLQVEGIDPDLWVHDLLIRFTAAFLDQGVSHWPLPEREKGFLHSFCALYRRGGGPPDAWFQGVPAELARIQDASLGPMQVIEESLARLGIQATEWDDFFAATLLALRGWCGMIREVEARADRVAHAIPPGTLLEFVAVRLMLDRFAADYAAKKCGRHESLSELRAALRAQIPAPVVPGIEERAWPVFLLAQFLTWTPEQLQGLSRDEWAEFVREIEAFDGLERRRVFHLAYERRFYNRTLDALALHERYRRLGLPRFQAITCLDEREESFRRHLEEVAPDCETYGAAGFFAAPMYYRGAADAHFVPLCPIVVVPRHWVEEQVEAEQEADYRRQRRQQRALGAAAHRAHVGTRSFALGAILSAIGVLASVPLVFRILFPRLTGRMRKHVGRIVHPPRPTRLKLERNPECQPGPSPDCQGFSLEEMTDQAERLLRDIGLTERFAPLVFILGHGSYSLNNPHKSAYDCGACGGSPGAPNGRAAAQILNDDRVRQALNRRGIRIPESTWAVGGLHNTCDDSVALFDLDRIPESHREEFERVRSELDEACDRNAHERCRRFMSAPLTMTPAEARRHVEGRSEDLAQTRPELGHATNAVCHVGRRVRIRGLFCDRRIFLTSYDPTQDDPQGTILARVMAAVFPVCGGINLEYYFSHVDPPGYGCSTKLPHNITALLGVMDGAMSDLRTGLPWQMTEIHEPVRLLIICETTPDVMQRVLANDPMGMTLTENGWVKLAVQSPETNELQLFENGVFRPYEAKSERTPAAKSSFDWYRGRRDHLEFAEIGVPRG
ncbi:MAG TPA: DUF2309 domain-containing protein [Urbifossiella sp.]|nr:DUF2309 domain-containing protein [Urbifossiella sp.]